MGASRGITFGIGSTARPRITLRSVQRLTIKLTLERSTVLIGHRIISRANVHSGYSLLSLTATALLGNGVTTPTSAPTGLAARVAGPTRLHAAPPETTSWRANVAPPGERWTHWLTASRHVVTGRGMPTPHPTDTRRQKPNDAHRRRCSKVGQQGMPIAALRVGMVLVSQSRCVAVIARSKYIQDERLSLQARLLTCFRSRLRPG